MSNGMAAEFTRISVKEGGVSGQSLNPGEIRDLAGELAEALVARGLSLGDVERLALLLVARVRRSPARQAADVPDGPRAQRRSARPAADRRP